ncbi:MAG: hypothetical protein Kow0026_25930 [Oricola sp.]
MARKPTPWKLDRPYDPDARAEALKRKFARYRERNGAGTRSRGGTGLFLPVWLLIALGIGVVLALAAGVA